MNQADFAKRVTGFKTSLAASFTGSYTKNNTDFIFKAGTIDVQTAESMKQVKSTDNLMVMVDDVTGKTETGGPRAGVANLGSRIGYFESSSDFSFDIDLMIHEFGHQMGLEHNWESSATGEDKKTGNYMSYENKRGHFSGHQLFQSMTASRNQGSNSSTVIDPNSQNNTTQAHPYKEAKTLDKIPKPIQ